MAQNKTDVKFLKEVVKEGIVYTINKHSENDVRVSFNFQGTETTTLHESEQAAENYISSIKLLQG